MSRRGKRVPKIAKTVQKAFEALGEDRVTARVLGALLGRRRQGIEAIAKRAGYGPPTVRKALRELEERGWVWSEALPSAKRGRRPMGYSLVERRGGLLDYYVDQARRRIVAQTNH